MTRKSATAAYTKWFKGAADTASTDPQTAALLMAAYMQGRRDLLKAQTVKRQHEARKARLTVSE